MEQTLVLQGWIALGLSAAILLGTVVLVVLTGILVRKTLQS